MAHKKWQQDIDDRTQENMSDQMKMMERMVRR